ncbi:MAG: flavodoxin domain-containing protein [Actinomycetaceae bacterium]|nr:flavodoxin domain-containing protein [Actinomycetaceae bacterium]
MKILLAVASKHGTTAELATWIASRLEEQGFEVMQAKAQDVTSLAGIDAIILGSAVYLTKWMDGAYRFIKTFEAELRRIPTFAFSVGLSRTKSGGVQDPSRVGPVLLTIEPIKYKTFKGALDPAKLNLRERTIAKLGGAYEGDFREHDEVNAWTDEIVAYLRNHETETGQNTE